MAKCTNCNMPIIYTFSLKSYNYEAICILCSFKNVRNINEIVLKIDSEIYLRQYFKDKN